MNLTARDFDDLPQGWSVETRHDDEVEFSRADRAVRLRLATDANHDNWVSLWPSSPDADPLFVQQFSSPRDAVRTAENLMEFYDVVRDRTVTQVMDRVSSTYSVLDAVEELEAGFDAEASGMAEQLTDRIGSALRQGDYDRVEQHSEAVKWVLGGQLDGVAE